jgi:UDP-N-acetylmuramoyl-L-alanyl-D-glutamate--2,6-diaminopimelate ligase
LRGRFNVDNVLCATALALLLDLPDEAIAAGVAAMPGVPGRFEAVDAGQAFAVIVDYAHTPGGIEAVLRSARPLARGRVACVVGAGGDRDRAKRPLMGRAAEDGADRVYVTSDNPRSEPPEAIIAEVVAGLRHPDAAVVEPDRRAAIARALHDAGEGDVVVIAGKGHEQGQDIGGVVHPFDDRSVARELLLEGVA